MSGVNFCQIHRQRPKVLDKILQATIGTVLRNKVQILWILASSEVLDGKGMAGQRAQGITLSEHCINLTVSRYVIFID